MLQCRHCRQMHIRLLTLITNTMHLTVIETSSYHQCLIMITVVCLGGWTLVMRDLWDSGSELVIGNTADQGNIAVSAILALLCIM